VSTSQVYLKGLPQDKPAGDEEPSSPRRLDIWMLLGICIAAGAMLAGIAATGVNLVYFFQPTGVLIVLGGTLGVMLITTPRSALGHAIGRAAELFSSIPVDREELIENLVSYNRLVRVKGIYSLEPVVARTEDPFLAESLLMAMDVSERAELQSALENKVRLQERQGEADAKILDVAGGFAPTIGVLGTVVGLIHVLRQFSTPSAVAYGVGTAFVSTIYGLALANLVLLPAAHRIRARVAEEFETHELIMEGVMCIFDRIHPSLVRQRLRCFLRHDPRGGASAESAATMAAQ